MTSWAWPCRCDGQTGYFFFESLNPKAVPVIDPISDVLEATARAAVDQEAATDAGALDDDYDARLRVYRQIVARRGQSGFRAALMEAYQGRCAITGCDAARPWKAPTCAPTADPNLIPLPMGCCCGPTFTRCSISASWLLTL